MCLTGVIQLQEISLACFKNSMDKINGSSESKIRKVIFNEVTLVIALASLVSGCIFWVSNPQNEMEIRIVQLESQLENNQTVVETLERIKNNDFVEFQEKLSQIEERQIEILQTMAAIKQQLTSLDD